MDEAGARERVRKPELLVMNSDLASYRREKDIPGALICLWGDLAGHCLILSSNIQLEEVTTHLHQLGQVFGEPAAIKYNECTGTIETEKYFGRLHGT